MAGTGFRAILASLDVWCSPGMGSRLSPGDTVAGLPPTWPKAGRLLRVLVIAAPLESAASGCVRHCSWFRVSQDIYCS